MKAKISLSNILAYLQGNYRYKLFYSEKFGWLMRKRIREQIEYRINSMDKECYNAGECKLCGCQTTALQMANKACDKPCYPEMIGARDWRILQAFPKALIYTNEWKIDTENKKFIKI